MDKRKKRLRWHCLVLGRNINNYSTLGLIEVRAGWAITKCTLKIDVITTRIVRCRVPQEKKHCWGVQRYNECNHLRRCPSHVSTEGTVCLFWSPESDFSRNWSWWFQCSFDYGQTPSSTNPDPAQLYYNILYLCSYEFSNVLAKWTICSRYNHHGK